MSTSATPGQKIRGIFLAGIFTAVPVYITVQILLFLFRFMDGFLAPPIERFLGVHIPGLGLLLAIVSLFLLGLFVTNFLGRRFYLLMERMIMRIPLASNIYTTSKRIVETFSPEGRRAFQKVVWLEYPRKGIWTLGFVTGSIQSSDGLPYYNIFIATTPNPTSGLVVFVAQAETVDSGFTTEEGFKLLVSAGLLAEGKQEFSSPKNLLVP